MPLETVYKSPEVILTTRATSKQQEYIKNLKCICLVLITYFLVAFSFRESLLLSLSVVVLLIGLVMMILNRPRVVMNSIKKYVQVIGKGGAESFKFSPSQVEKIMVKTRRMKSGKPEKLPPEKTLGRRMSKKQDPNLWYYTQIFLKSPKGRRRLRRPGKLTVNTFELQDIVEAHYLAQLISAFTGAPAFDIKGRRLPQIKSHIPTRFLREE